MNDMFAAAAAEFREARDRHCRRDGGEEWVKSRSGEMLQADSREGRAALAEWQKIETGQSQRAVDLQMQMAPLHRIKPNLSSRYLVKGWLDRGALSVVFAESNVGKSFLAIDLSMHIAAGTDWNGNRIPEDIGAVVYVAGEGGLGIDNRIEAMRRERQGLMRDVHRRNGFHLLKIMLDLTGSEDADHLVSAIRLAGVTPSLIIIDTLAMAFGSGDENTAKDMTQFVKSCAHIRAETGAHVMVIHHSGKDTAKGARGSGALRAASDTEIELTRDGPVILATQRKQRDMATDATFAFTLRSVFIGDDEDGEKVFSAVVEQTEAPTKKPPRLKGQPLIAMQAFGDALAAYGETKTGSEFPPNRQCVPLERWREACDRHSLTDGTSDSASRQAFGRAWKGLQEKGVIRVIDGFAWRCADA